MIDHVSFNDLCSRLIGAERKRSGIGTLGEKTPHFIGVSGGGNAFI